MVSIASGEETWRERLHALNTKLEVRSTLVVTQRAGRLGSSFLIDIIYLLFLALTLFGKPECYFPL